MNNVDIGRYSKRIVQYLWDPEPTPTSADQPSPVWCLGRRYELERTDPIQDDAVSPSAGPSSNASAVGSNDTGSDINSTNSSFEEVEKTAASKDVGPSEKLSWPTAFVDDFESRIWLSYRSGFAEIAKSQDPKASSMMSLSVRLKSQLSAQHGFTSDTGWGCMIRSGQCLLANALSLLRLGRGMSNANPVMRRLLINESQDWRRASSHPNEGEIFRLFADDPCAPFSIHQFVEHGAAACGTYPGQWFGPSATANCIEALVNNREGGDLKVYKTGDGPDVFEDGVFKVACGEDGQFKPTLLLIGTRLGIDRVTPAYWPALRACLQVPQAVGIAGGRPSASHYFVGVQENDLFYLDPHHTRPALPLRASDNYTIDEVDSCHTRRLRKLPLDDMDPSMLIAFLIRDASDWKDWRKAISDVEGKAVVYIADVEPSHYGMGGERDGAVDEVQILDDDEDDVGEAQPTC